MAMSDCPMCWNTPCSCGWDYRHWNLAQLDKLITILISIRRYKLLHPAAVFSGFSSCSPVTEDDQRLMEELQKDMLRDKTQI